MLRKSLVTSQTMTLFPLDILDEGIVPSQEQTDDFSGC